MQDAAPPDALALDARPPDAATPDGALAEAGDADTVRVDLGARDAVVDLATPDLGAPDVAAPIECVPHDVVVPPCADDMVAERSVATNLRGQVVADGAADPGNLLLADVDGDGDLDVVVSPFEGGQVGLAENLGGGRFAFVRPLFRSTRAVVRAADLDLDGHLDLVTAPARGVGGMVQWVPGSVDGPGDLQPIGQHAVIDEIDVGDVDSDGLIDVVVSGRDGIWAHFNEAAGARWRAVQLADGASRKVQLVDLDGDGHSDLVFEDGMDVVWAPNQGAGEFGPTRVAVRADAPHESIAAGDLDGDGDVDLVASFWPVRGSGAIHRTAWFANAGDGTFGPEQVLDDTAALAGYTERGIGVADMDGDCVADIWVSGAYGARAYLRQPDGFSAPHDLAHTPQTQHGAAVGDIDGDGTQDYVTATSSDRAVRWYPNPQTPLPLRVPGTSPAVIALGGGALHVATDSRDDGITVRRLEHARLGGPVQLEHPRASWHPLRVGDLDGDGHEDLVAAGRVNNAEHLVVWFRNRGESLEPAAVLIEHARPISDLALQDMDLDGDLDLLLAVHGDGASWYPGDGAGRLDEVQPIGLGRSPLAFMRGDLDGDGDDELLYAATDGVTALIPGADGTVVVRPARISGTPLRAVHVADLDGDGQDDLIVANRDGVGVIRNRGPEGFDQPMHLARLRDEDVALAAFDVDGDGDLDPIAGQEWWEAFRWYPQLDRFEFGLARDLVQCFGPRWARIVDFDRDGDEDVVIGTFGGSLVLWNDALCRAQ